jgi:hypothetical protein
VEAPAPRFQNLPFAQIEPKAMLADHRRASPAERERARVRNCFTNLEDWLPKLKGEPGSVFRGCTPAGLPSDPSEVALENRRTVQMVTLFCLRCLTSSRLLTK